MSESESPRIRAPRGTKAVADAFFAALNEIPDARRSDVAKAAQSAIRDALKVQRDKAKMATRRARTEDAPVPTRRRGAVAAKTNGGRKPARRIARS